MKETIPELICVYYEKRIKEKIGIKGVIVKVHYLKMIECYRVLVKKNKISREALIAFFKRENMVIGLSEEISKIFKKMLTIEVRRNNF